MDQLPTEIINKEIGNYLDIPSMISMSFICKEFQDIYQPQFSKILNQMDPYIINGNVNDFLNIMKIGTVENFTYKFWRIIFQTIIKEMELLYPYISRKSIIQTFYKVVPLDAIDTIKNHIQIFITKTDMFIIYKKVVYRNPTSTAYLELSEAFETDINDMIDTLLHELAATEKPMERDSSSESITDDSLEDMIDYFPYENVTDTIETWLRYL